METTNKILTHGSLFSGIGGFDLAASWMGWENVFHCEINSFGQKILQYYWPNSISYDDIKKTDFTVHRGRIDVLTGGFPCQPFSQAGKRKGTEDDRHLWPEMLRAIREIQPVYIVGENVRGITNWNGGLVFDQVQADLENEGFEVLPFLLPACSVNAPHRRDRIWFVAYSKSFNATRTRRLSNNKQSCNKTENRERFWNKSECDVSISVITNPKRSSIKRKLQQRQRQRKFRGCNSGTEIFTNTERGGCTQNDKQFTPGKSELPCPRWEWFPTQSPICSRNDGISTKLDGITFPKFRNESIKAYGNAIVPQVVYEIFKVISSLF